MAQIININVSNKKATSDFHEVITYNTEYNVVFTLDDEWWGYTKRTVVFLWEGGGIERMITSTSCPVPPLKDIGEELLIGIYSRSETGYLSSSYVRFRCEEGAHAIAWENQEEEKTFRDDVLAFLNKKDWTIFDSKVKAGTYSAVQVNAKGFCTAGKASFEVGVAGQTTPSQSLIDGGIFYQRAAEGVYRLCQKVSGVAQPMTVEGVNLANSLTVGGKSYNGSFAVTLSKSDFGLENAPNFHPYPVGAIYLSVSSTSPASLFGGTWERLKDKFLLAAGDSYAAGSTGGEDSHVLSLNEMPNHRHDIIDCDTQRILGRGFGANVAGMHDAAAFSLTDNIGAPFYTSYDGGSAAHNNMPPYFSVYCWKRTA